MAVPGTLKLIKRQEQMTPGDSCPHCAQRQEEHQSKESVQSVFDEQEILEGRNS